MAIDVITPTAIEMRWSMKLLLDLNRLIVREMAITDMNSKYFFIFAIFIWVQNVVIPMNIPIIEYIIAEAPTVGMSYIEMKEETKEMVVTNSDSVHLLMNFSKVRNIPMKANEFIAKCTIPACWNI